MLLFKPSLHMRDNTSVARIQFDNCKPQNCTTWYPRHAKVTFQGLHFTAKVFAPFYSKKQDYGGTKSEIPVKNRPLEWKIQESGGFQQELVT